MGVYVPFANRLPSSCDFCYISLSGCKARNPYVDGRPTDCPLVEVPKHGRLIDADELKGKFFYYELHGMRTANTTFARVLRDAPTIIEAEGEDVN